MKELKSVSGEIKALALGIPEVESAVVGCAQAGFSGYVPCEASTKDLVVAIETAADDNLHCSPRVAACLFRRIGRSLPETASGEPEVSLTEREVEVLGLVQEGLSNKAISQRLGIGLQTVKNHVQSIFSKLGVQNRVAAAALFASRMGKVTTVQLARGRSE